mgnify:CR=1 FL=1
MPSFKGRKAIKLILSFLQPLRYARLEKADILEMVVKHLKDLKRRKQAMIAAMEPMLYRSFKMGFLDCTRASIDFINEIASPAERKQQIIDHITQECMKTLQNHRPLASFHQHHEIVFANVNPPDHFIPFPLLSSSFDSGSEMEDKFEWPSLEERLGFSPITKSNFLLPDVKPLPELFSMDVTSSTASSSSSLLKIAESTPSRNSAFNLVINKSSSFADSSLESPSTSGTSGICSASDETQQQSILITDNTSDDDNITDDDDEEGEDGKLIIDDQNNNNQAAWRPWM